MPLDQHVHVSFMIRDGEESQSFKDLSDEFLFPAMKANATFLDQVLLGQMSQFIANSYGQLGGMTTSNAQDYILGVREVMNVNKAYMNGRNLILNPTNETTLLGLGLFVEAHKVGDQGQALREAYLGRKFGYDMYMCQNMPYLPTTTTDKVTGAINLSAGYPKGTTSFTVDGLSAEITNNSFITIAGDMTPLRVVSTTGGSTPTAIVVKSPGIRSAVVNDAVVTIYDPGAVNLLAGYAAGYSKAIAVDGFTNFPAAGQLVSFGTSSNNAVYSIVRADSSGGTIYLDRPLEAAIVNDDTVNVGPNGGYNFAFHRNAVALVSRPLALPRQGTGALAAVVNYNNLSVRVVITYDGKAQGHRITIDLLLGVKMLDMNLGAVLLG